MDWNELIKTNLASLIDFIKQSATAVKDEIPKYVEELIRYEIFRNAFLLIGMILLIIAAVLLLKKIFAITGEVLAKFPGSDGPHVVRIFASLIAIGGIGFLLYIIAGVGQDLGKVIVAPRVYVVEKIQTMIKN